MTGAEVAAIVGPITTLAGALGGVGLTLGYQRGRERRDAKREVYIRWVQFAENLPTWAFKPGFHFSDFTQAIQDRIAELDLVASPKVRQAVREYVTALQPVQQRVVAIEQEVAEAADPQQQALAFAHAFRAVNPQRDRVLDTMRKDLRIK
jgi:hypothetical protein